MGEQGLEQVLTEELLVLGAEAVLARRFEGFFRFGREFVEHGGLLKMVRLAPPAGADTVDV